MRLAIPALAAALLPTVASGAAASPLYLKVYDRTIVGRNAFIEGRDTVALPATYQDHQLTLYAAYDLYPRLRVTVDAVPIGVAAYDGKTRAYFGGGAFGVEAELWRGPVILGAAIRVGGRPEAPELGRPTVDGTELVVTPVVGTFLGGAAGTLLWPLEWGWVAARVGAEAYGALELSPAVFGNAQLGWRTRSPLELALQVQLWHATEVDPPVNVLGSGNTRYLGFDLDATWWFSEGFGLFAGVGGVVYATHNAATPSLRLGVQLR